MKIENDIKLDFIDVLIRPKRTNLSTRSEVDIIKSVKFVNSKQTWEGVPIITSNMDTIGTIEMYNVLKNYSKQIFYSMALCRNLRPYKILVFINYIKNELVNPGKIHKNHPQPHI